MRGAPPPLPPPLPPPDLLPSSPSHLAGLRAAPLRRSVRQAVRAAAGSDEDVGTAGKAAIALGLLANPITLWSE